MQELIPDDHTARLLDNGKTNNDRRDAGHQPEDFYPVVKLFYPLSAATWLLTELDPDDPDLAFGLCDLGMGAPELGYVRLSELKGIRGMGGTGIERDEYFTPKKGLSAYADEARNSGAIRA